MLHGNRFAIYGVSALFLHGLMVGAAPADQPKFPYSGFIQVEAAAVRSGPGGRFYTTDRLNWGTRIEVHRHDNHDWAAIRPPEGSFSWVRSELLEPSGQAGLARIVADDVMSAIGTRYGHRRDTRHVSLRAGDVVEVLGRRELPAGGDAASGLWAKISPPTGEFRWIRLSDLSQHPPTQTGVSSTPDEGETVDRHPADARGSKRSDVRRSEDKRLPPHPSLSPAIPAARGGGEGTSESANRLKQQAEVASGGRHVASVLVEITRSPGITEEERQDSDDSTSDNDARAARVDEQIADWESREPDLLDEHATDATPIAAFVNDHRSSSLTSGFREVAPPSEERVAVAERGPASPAVPSAGRDPRSGRDLSNDQVSIRFGPIMGVGQERLADELSQVDLALTRTIINPPQEWTLDSLRARAQAVIDTSDSASLRRRGHNLLASIAKFEDVQRRHLQLLAGNVSHITSASSLARLGETGALRGEPGAAPDTSRSRPEYDGKGWLMPVVTRRTGTPRYALTDDSGHILQFVTPPPGVNIRKYERRRIAIYGEQGYLPQLNKPHLAAQRIISLDTLR